MKVGMRWRFLTPLCSILLLLNLITFRIYSFDPFANKIGNNNSNNHYKWKGEVREAALLVMKFTIQPELKSKSKEL